MVGACRIGGGYVSNAIKIRQHDYWQRWQDLAYGRDEERGACTRQVGNHKGSGRARIQELILERELVMKVVQRFFSGEERFESNGQIGPLNGSVNKVMIIVAIVDIENADG